jgi:hypothetical protein
MSFKKVMELDEAALNQQTVTGRDFHITQLVER